MPVGTEDAPYTGSFDGAGYSITGIKASSSSDYVGMFGYIGSDGTVKDLGLIKADISGDGYVGAIAGYNEGTIIACYSEDSKVEGDYYVGGIAGYNYNYSYNFTGDTIINDKGKVLYSYSDADVSGSQYVGGIVGYNTDYATVAACYFTGSLDGTSCVGGIVGFNYGVYLDSAPGNVIDVGYVYACYSEAAIENSSGKNYIGGIVGRNHINHGRVYNSYYTTVAIPYACGALSGSAGTSGTDETCSQVGSYADAVSDMNQCLSDNGFTDYMYADSSVVSLEKVANSELSE